MDQPTITFVINGKTFSLSANDSRAIGAIPAAERGQLMALLAAVKQQEEQAAAVAREVVDRAGREAVGSPVTAQAAGPTPTPERLGSGDVDALMARLAMEENRNRKAAPTRQGIYRWVLGFAAVVVLLVLIF